MMLGIKISPFLFNESYFAAEKERYIQTGRTSVGIWRC